MYDPELDGMYDDIPEKTDLWDMRDKTVPYSKSGMSKYLSRIIDSNHLEKADRETLFALFVEMEQMIDSLEARIEHLEKATLRVDAYGKKL